MFDNMFKAKKFSFQSMATAVTMMALSTAIVLSASAAAGSGGAGESGRPDLVSVDKAANELGAALSKEVMINVAVYSVNLNDGDKASVDWNLVWGAANGSNNTYQGLDNSSLAGLRSPSAMGILKGAFAEPSAVANVLSTLGKTSLIASANLVTLSGKSVPMAVEKEVGYLRSITTTVTESSGASKTSTDPGFINVGFDLNVLPLVQPNGNILIEYKMDMSDLESWVSFTSNGNTIRAPNRSVRNYSQRASMRSGETLVLSGFKQVVAKVKNQSVSNTGNILLGGAKQAQNSNVQLVVIITPVVSK